MRRAKTIGAPSVFVNKNGLGRFPQFRDQGVGGSNPLSPTISNQQLPKSPGIGGLPKGLTFALAVRVAPKTRATP